MKILGVDPGMARTGYGVIEKSAGGYGVLCYGCITTDSGQNLAHRLHKIYDELNEVIDLHSPGELAIEEVFFAKNAKLALTIGQARGIVLLLAVQRAIPTFEYSVREIKQAVVGNGGASKVQVQRMITNILALPEEKRYYDVSDALAVALCHSHRRP